MKLSDMNLLSVGHTIQMTGAIYSGEGKTFLAFFPEDKKDLPLETLEMSLPEWETFLRQTDLLEAEVLAKASDGTLCKAIVRKSQRQVDQNVTWKVFRRDNFSCRYCGNDSVPLTIDHLVLWEEGGPTSEANLVASCRKCNKTRGNTSYEDWLNHAYYKQVSTNLGNGIQKQNRDLLGTLPTIPRVLHKRSR